MNQDLPGGTFRVQAGVQPVSSGREVTDRPFFVALMGDFSGRAAREGDGADASDVSSRTPLPVDRDDLDVVMARLAPSIEIEHPKGAEHVQLTFTELDDFHPDHLLEHAALFGDLRATRDQLADPGGFAKFKERLKENGTQQPKPPAVQSLSPPEGGSLLDQILDGSPTRAASAALEDGGLKDFVKRVVAPHEVSKADPTQAEIIAELDEQMASRMRWVLHRPEFQALEALWRGAWFLCRRVETSSTLRLFLIDISKEELLRDQSADVPLEKSGLYRLLVESTVGTPGATPWSLLVGCYSFGSRMDDLKLLARVGAIADLANATWLSAAEGVLVGCSSFGSAPDSDQWAEANDAGWGAIRTLPYAGRIGLAMPRFLLRVPYGRDTDECDRLALEEMKADGHEHEDYLWGNPALLCALLLAQAYSLQGSGMRLGGNLEVSKLPLHMRKTADETIAQPCAEALLTERALTRICDRGLMAFASIKDRDAVRLLRFQSISDPPTSLGGPWT